MDVAGRTVLILGGDLKFWGEQDLIQPGKVVSWIFAVEEKGARMK